MVGEQMGRKGVGRRLILCRAMVFELVELESVYLFFKKYLVSYTPDDPLPCMMGGGLHKKILIECT